MRTNSFFARSARWLAIALTATTLGACQLSPTKSPTPGPLQLIGSGALAVPASCEATGSFVVDFTVLENGSTGNIRPADAPECLQQALTAWVSSFRYSPVGEPTQASIEWLLVQAKKGS